MQQEDGTSGSTSSNYRCSNPNCKSVFSQPKIIMYSVCPICQTIIGTTAAVFQAGLVEEEHAQTEQNTTTASAAESEKPQSQEPRAMEQPKIEELEKIETEAVEAKTTPLSKMIEPKAKAQTEGFETKTTASKTIPPPETTLQTRTSEQRIAEQKTILRQPVQKVPDNVSSSKTCQYYFGYLSQREKGEEIPISCIECSKSLDCMLAEYHKSKESVEEIRKWYQLKH